MMKSPRKRSAEWAAGTYCVEHHLDEGTCKAAAYRQLRRLEERYCKARMGRDWLEHEPTRAGTARNSNVIKIHKPFVTQYTSLHEKYKATDDPYIKLQLLRQLDLHFLHWTYQPWLDLRHDDVQFSSTGSESNSPTGGSDSREDEATLATNEPILLDMSTISEEAPTAIKSPPCIQVIKEESPSPPIDTKEPLIPVESAASGKSNDNESTKRKKNASEHKQPPRQRIGEASSRSSDTQKAKKSKTPKADKGSKQSTKKKYEKRKKAAKESDVDPMADIPCSGCGELKDPSNCLICEECEIVCWHYYCLEPPLDGIPESRWICPACSSKAASKHSSSEVNTSSLPEPQASEPGEEIPQTQRKRQNKRRSQVLRESDEESSDAEMMMSCRINLGQSRDSAQQLRICDRSDSSHDNQLADVPSLPPAGGTIEPPASRLIEPAAGSTIEPPVSRIVHPDFTPTIQSPASTTIPPPSSSMTAETPSSGRRLESLSGSQPGFHPETDVQQRQTTVDLSALTSAQFWATPRKPTNNNGSSHSCPPVLPTAKPRRRGRPSKARTPGSDRGFYPLSSHSHQEKSTPLVFAPPAEGSLPVPSLPIVSPIAENVSKQIGAVGGTDVPLESPSSQSMLGYNMQMMSTPQIPSHPIASQLAAINAETLSELSNTYAQQYQQYQEQYEKQQYDQQQQQQYEQQRQRYEQQQKQLEQQQKQLEQQQQYEQQRRYEKDQYEQQQQQYEKQQQQQQQQ
eukprot:Filipodium_phascolosomae@DN1384_c0_g1_i1.p1